MRIRRRVIVLSILLAAMATGCASVPPASPAASNASKASSQTDLASWAVGTWDLPVMALVPQQRVCLIEGGKWEWIGAGRKTAAGTWRQDGDVLVLTEDGATGVAKVFGSRLQRKGESLVGSAGEGVAPVSLMRVGGTTWSSDAAPTVLNEQTLIGVWVFDLDGTRRMLTERHDDPKYIQMASIMGGIVRFEFKPDHTCISSADALAISVMRRYARKEGDPLPPLQMLRWEIKDGEVLVSLPDEDDDHHLKFENGRLIVEGEVVLLKVGKN